MLKYWKHLAVAFAACLVLVLMAQPAEAVGGQQGAFTYELKGNGTAVITKFDWSMHSGGDVYVPRSIDGYEVTEIGSMAFSDAAAGFPYDRYQRSTTVGTQVTVVLPDTITVIASKAFFCTNILACDIPASVQRIGEAAFAGCPYIRKFSVNSSNKVYAVIDGVLFHKSSKTLVAFPLSYAESEYTIPQGIREIGPYAFYFAGSDCYFQNARKKYERYDPIWGDLKITIPDTVTTVGEYAFYHAFVEPTDVPASLTVIKDYAFCDSYCDIDYNTSELMCKPVSIGAYAFANSHMYYFWWHFSLENLTSLGEHAFEENDCAELLLKTLASAKITEIPEGAFASASFNRSVEQPICLPESLQIIGTSAFSETKFMSLVIPANVHTIESNAFSKARYLEISFADGSQLRDIGASAFKEAVFLNTEFSIPEGCETLGEMAFNGCSGLQKLVVPESVTSIGDQVVDRTATVMQVTPGSYADLWATENGYPIEADDTSWLFE